MSASNKKCGFVVASCILATALAVPANSQGIAVRSYDLVKDFSITANPDGAFSYGWTSGVPALNAFNLYTTEDSFSVAGMTS